MTTYVYTMKSALSDDKYYEVVRKKPFKKRPPNVVKIDIYGEGLTPYALWR